MAGVPNAKKARPLTSERAREVASKRWAGVHNRLPFLCDLRADLQSGLPLFKVVQALNDAVQAGEPWAVALWLAYVCGRPTNQNELTLKQPPSARRLTDEQLLEILANHGVFDLPGGAQPGQPPTEDPSSGADRLNEAPEDPPAG